MFSKSRLSTNKNDTMGFQVLQSVGRLGSRGGGKYHTWRWEVISGEQVPLDSLEQGESERTEESGLRAR